jgi:hypothetical protein
MWRMAEPPLGTCGGVCGIEASQWCSRLETCGFESRFFVIFLGFLMVYLLDDATADR